MVRQKSNESPRPSRFRAIIILTNVPSGPQEQPRVVQRARGKRRQTESVHSILQNKPGTCMYTRYKPGSDDTDAPYINFVRRTCATMVPPVRRAQILKELKGGTMAPVETARTRTYRRLFTCQRDETNRATAFYLQNAKIENKKRNGQGGANTRRRSGSTGVRGYFRASLKKIIALSTRRRENPPRRHNWFLFLFFYLSCEGSSPAHD